MTPAAQLPRRSRARREFRRGTRLAALGLVIAALTSCTRSSPLESTDTTLSPILTDDKPLVGNSATTAPPPPTTEAPLGGSPARLAPLNVGEHDMTIKVGKDRSRSHLVALVPIQTDRAVAETGTCVALLWTIDALATSDLLLDRDAIPTADAVAGDTEIEGDGSPDCDRRDVRDAGWGNRGQIRILPEASFNVATAFFIPKGTPDLDYLVLTGPDDERLYYEATVSSGLPELPPTRLGAAPTNVEPADPEGKKPFKYGDSFQRLEVSVRGIVPDVARVDGAPGSCVSIIGTIKPLKTVGAIMNALAVPEVRLIINGVAVEPSPTRCGSATLSSNRWYPIQQAGVSTRNTFAFAQSYAVNSEDAVVQAIVIGNLFKRADRRVYAVHPFDSTPEAPAREKVNPKLALRPVRPSLWTDTVVPDTTAPPTTGEPGATTAPTTSTTTTTTTPASTTPGETGAATTTAATPAKSKVRQDGLVSIQGDARWTAAVYGLHPLPSDAAAATCYAVLLSWRVTDGKPNDPPSLGIIAGGAYWGSAETEATCDTTTLTDAGWKDASSADYQNATNAPMKVFVPIFIPDDGGDLAAIGVGNVADDVNVAYFSPTVIEAIPGGNTNEGSTGSTSSTSSTTSSTEAP